MRSSEDASENTNQRIADVLPFPNMLRYRIYFGAVNVGTVEVTFAARTALWAVILAAREVSLLLEITSAAIST